MITGLAGIAITPGSVPETWKILVFALAILLSSASAGAFNQYIERDLDALMDRTRRRPFVTGEFDASNYWLAVIVITLLLAVISTCLAINIVSALYVFLGAFIYGVVYTVWLKRRTWLNIVIGGLSGSFAVLAGAAVVDPVPGMAPILLAIVLFLWTPPHFWSLAFVFSRDYKKAGIPMLPVVVDKHLAARIIFLHTLALVMVSIISVFFGPGWIYLSGALAASKQRLAKKERARKNFRASLLQLSLLLTGCILDSLLL